MVSPVDHCNICTKLLTIVGNLGQYKVDFLKVYKSHNGYKEVPQIKIKNKKLINAGFRVGTEFTIIYECKKITLLLSDKKDSKYNKGPLHLFD